MIFKNASKINRDISVIGLGCWGLSGSNVWEDCTDSESIETVHRAVELGVNFFDVAPVYGFGHAERILGKALKESTVKRDDVIIASKCGLEWNSNGDITNNLKPERIIKEIDQSLERLNVNYIDIYQLHWPDPAVELEQTLEALINIKDCGKIKAVGLTNFSILDTEKAMTQVEIVSLQGLYNMLERNPASYHNIPLEYKSEDELIPFCQKNDMAFLPYSPLMQGLLCGGFNEDNNFSENDIRSSNPRLCGVNFKRYYVASLELKQLAEEYGHPLNELAFNWLIDNSAITSIIAGGNKPWQIESNIKSLEWSMDKELLERVNTILEPFKSYC